MSEYVPTKDDVRNEYATKYHGGHWYQPHAEEFDRWLTAHDQAAEMRGAVMALRAAAAFVDEYGDEGEIWRGDPEDDQTWWQQPIHDYLNARADQIESAAKPTEGATE